MKVELPFLEVAEAVRQYLGAVDADVHFTASIGQSGSLENLTAVVETDQRVSRKGVVVGSATARREQ